MKFQHCALLLFLLLTFICQAWTFSISLEGEERPAPAAVYHGGALTNTPKNTWVQIAPNSGVPVSRSQHAMAATQQGSEGNELLFLFWGIDPLTDHIFEDIWIYHRGIDWWYQINATCSPGQSLCSPSPRAAATATPATPSWGPIHFNIDEDGYVSSVASSPPNTLDNCILVFGGSITSIIVPSDVLWCFDTTSFEWRYINTSTSPHGRAYHSAAFAQGSLFILGGAIGGSTHNDFWKFNTSSQTWTTLSNYPGSGISSQSSVARNDEEIYVFGGTPAIDPTNNLFVYNVTANTWEQVGPGANDTIWPPARSGHVGIYLSSLDVMVIYGGLGVNGEILNDAWQYSFANMSWSEVGGSTKTLPTGGFYQQAAVGIDGDTVLIFGGDSGSLRPPQTPFFQWNVTEGSWTQIESPMPSAPQPTVTTFDANQTSLYALQIFGTFARYDLRKNFWENLPSLPVAQTSMGLPIAGFLPLNETHLVAFQSVQTNISALQVYIFDSLSADWTSFQRIYCPCTNKGPYISEFSNYLSYGGNILIVSAKQIFQIDVNDWTLSVVANITLIGQAKNPSSVIVENVLYVFGLGVDTSFFLTYDLVNQTWEQVNANATTPAGLIQTSVVALGVKIFFYGGSSLETVYGDFWEYNTRNQTWTKVMIKQPITARYSAALAGTSQPNNHTFVFLFGGTNGWDYLTDFWVVDLGCNPGTICEPANFTLFSCEPCGEGTYSSVAGVADCRKCPFGTTTASNGSLLIDDCIKCVEEPVPWCHHGNCTVVVGVGAVCVCHAGYLEFDRCFFPWIWMGGCLGVIAVAALIVVGVKRYRNKLRRQKETIEEQLEEIVQMREVWKIEESEITWVSPLSSGGFGEVWKCEWRENIVAVKKLHQHWLEADPTTAEEFENEVKMLRSIRHPRIVLFFGAGKLVDGTPFLVTEFVPRGSLTTYLRSKHEAISWKQKISFLLDAANGMQFLHSSNPPRIHRDMKPQNLLVTSNLRVKIADFGTAKLVWQGRKANDHVAPSAIVQIELGSSGNSAKAQHVQSRSNSQGPFSTTKIGTLPYMAPELHTDGRRQYGKEVDVYSYGLTMWVIANETGEDPFTDIPEYAISDRVQAGERPKPGLDWPPNFVHLMQRCWDGDVLQRPTFDEIAAELNALYLDYIDQQK